MVRRYEMMNQNTVAFVGITPVENGRWMEYEDHLAEVAKLKAAEAEAFMLMEQAERKYMEARSLLENVACLAHGGGLIDLSEAEVLTAIRKLSISSFIQKLSAPLLNESLEVADAEYKNFSRKNKTT